MWYDFCVYLLRLRRYYSGGTPLHVTFYIAGTCDFVCPYMHWLRARQLHPNRHRHRRWPRQNAGCRRARQTSAPPASNVPMNEPVITLKGACQPRAGSRAATGCVCSMTREQFEKLTNALQPPTRSGAARRQAQLRLPIREAADLRPTPRASWAWRTIPRCSRSSLRQKPDPGRGAESALRGRVRASDGSADRRLLQAEHQEVPGSHAAAHHHSAGSRHRRTSQSPAKLSRRLTPRRSGSAGSPVKIRPSWKKKPWSTRGQPTPPPDVNVGARRPGSLPEAHEAVFDLKAGEISPVFSRSSRVLHLQGGFGSPGSAERSEDAPSRRPCSGRCSPTRSSRFRARSRRS